MQDFAVETFDALLAQRETAKLPAALKLHVWAPVTERLDRTEVRFALP